jgi:hypothetical protein
MQIVDGRLWSTIPIMVMVGEAMVEEGVQRVATTAKHREVRLVMQVMLVLKVSMPLRKLLSLLEVIFFQDLVATALLEKAEAAEVVVVLAVAMQIGQMPQVLEVEAVLVAAVAAALELGEEEEVLVLQFSK